MRESVQAKSRVFRIEVAGGEAVLAYFPAFPRY
jgi:hypothetical protein